MRSILLFSVLTFSTFCFSQSVELGRIQHESIKGDIILLLDGKENLECGSNTLMLQIPETDMSLIVLSATGGALILKDQEKGIWNFIPTCPAEGYKIYVSQRNKIKQIKQLKQLGTFELTGLQ
ncbi:MAG: hypothetical protein EP305_03760 [Bacteroidetes bacterium]|nr:MAG: hypothetical protein EP305_03760 [Bacteroidota bacterium]